MLRSHGLEPRQITDVAISSTVPAVQRTMEDMAGRYFELTPFVVDPGVNVALGMRVDYPREVGPDRVVKVVAAVELYGPPLIIIDFGTATTFECVSPGRGVHRRRDRAGDRDGGRGAHRPGGPALPRRPDAAAAAPSGATPSRTSSRAWSTATRAWSTAWSPGCARRWMARRRVVATGGLVGLMDGPRPHDRRRESAPDAGGTADRVRAGPTRRRRRRARRVGGLTRGVRRLLYSPNI